MKIQGLDGKQYPDQRQPVDHLLRRRAVVLFLRERGWSIRRIADEVGWSVGTIFNDLQESE